MRYKYTKKILTKTLESMENVQDILAKAGIVDAKLLPLFEQAEQGDYAAMSEVSEMFTYGRNNVQANFDIAIHYWSKINEINQRSNDPTILSESLNSYAYIHYEFDKLEEATAAFLKAFKYMVSNLEPKDWDAQIIKLVADNIEIYQQLELTI